MKSTLVPFNKRERARLSRVAQATLLEEETIVRLAVRELLSNRSRLLATTFLSVSPPAVQH
jgi:hypothetical protein